MESDSGKQEIVGYDGNWTEKKRPALSDRERQLITLAAEGLTDYAIAMTLGIKEPTVKSYWVRIRSKVGPFNRTELVALAVREAYELHVRELGMIIESLRDELSSATHKAAAERRDIIQKSEKAEKGRSQELSKVGPDPSALRNEILQRSKKAAEDLREELLNAGQIASVPRREILQKSKQAALEGDATGRFIWLNTAAENMFGYDPGELNGEHVSRLIPQHLRKNHDEQMTNFYKSPYSMRAAEIICTGGLKKDGKEITIVGTLGSHETDGGLVVTSLIRELAV